MIAPGQLNRRLLLEAASETDDGAGGFVRSYETVTTLWAQVTPLAARSDLAADSLGGAVRYRITIRWRSDVTTRHRFQDSGHIYRILAVREGADRRFIEIDAEERKD